MLTLEGIFETSHAWYQTTPAIAMPRKPSNTATCDTPGRSSCERAMMHRHVPSPLGTHDKRPVPRTPAALLRSRSLGRACDRSRVLEKDLLERTIPDGRDAVIAVAAAWVDTVRKVHAAARHGAVHAWRQEDRAAEGAVLADECDDAVTRVVIEREHRALVDLRTIDHACDDHRDARVEREDLIEDEIHAVLDVRQRVATISAFMTKEVVRSCHQQNDVRVISEHGI